MAYAITSAYKQIKGLKENIKIVQGGTRAGKTIAILLILLDIAVNEKCLITVAGANLPHLKRGALRDFVDIITEDRGGTTFMDYYRIERNRAENTFTLFNGSVIEFVALDEDKARGSKRDYLFINECNLVSFATFEQLEMRTEKQTWLDFNPVNEFWVHNKVLNNKEYPSVDFIKLTYKDNEALSDKIRAGIEAKRGDGTSNWWRVYGLGEIGSLEGNVYEGWTKVDSKPEGFVLKRYGLDFGFSNDPTACVAVYENEAGEIYLEPKLYETKLLTPALIERIKGFEPALFVCDNARPEIIAEMQHNGLRAIGSDKTPGEKMNGKRYNIELVLRRKIFYSGDDIEKEFLTYAWRRKKSGEQLDEPQDGNDHYMDAISYAIRDMGKPKIDWGTGGVVF